MVEDGEFLQLPAPAGATPAAAPPPGVVIRRSIVGPDASWHVLGAQRRWYVYADDRPVGYLDAATWGRGSVRQWAPFTFARARLGRPERMIDALDRLLHFDATGRTAFRLCPVCGRRTRHNEHEYDPHRAPCPLISGLFDSRGESEPADAAAAGE